ncbi:MAG: AhpC/TSA family protein [Odoribacteraceae bacterium]|jgi:thiol-disulfide isomerase/thioredoxin|nr:AhpC/TSA family protein [Odoribacteraceae bacterium]
MKTIFILLLATLSFGANAQQPFELSGRISGKENVKIYLSYMTAWGETPAKDSASIVNGAFHFQGEIRGATNASLYLNPNDKDDIATFYIEEGKMTIDVTAGDFKNYRLTGSRANDEYKELEVLNADLTREIRPLLEAYYAEQDPDKKAAILEQVTLLQSQVRANQDQFTREHPDSYVSAFLLFVSFSSLSSEEARNGYDALSERVKQGVMGRALGRELEKLQNGSPGSVASLFSKPADILGTPFELAALVGKKYILLDFWASWCVPCRQGNPHLKALYQEYKDDLFVVCVSDDDSAPDRWRAAVEQDGLHDFYHVLRGLKRSPTGGFDRSEDISELYGIHALPTKILIDKNGVIIGRYVGDSSALDEQLKTLFPR